MGNDKRDRQNREADLVQEVERLRASLKQAGIDAEQHLRESEASERRHVHDVTEERARTEVARADVDEIRIGSRIRLQWCRRSRMRRWGLTCRWRTPVPRSVLVSKLSPMRTTYCFGRTGPELI